jgi:sugar phosphate isomerase/epimerase
MKIDQVAVQLYTLRNHLKTPADMAKTLKRVRDIGYRSVQVSGVGEIDPAEFAKMCSGEGLSICATHESGQMILETPGKVVEKLAALGCTITAYPFPAGVDFGKEEDVAGLIEGLSKAGRVLKDAGMTLCYHNHAHEFRKLNGKVILDRIYEETSAEVLAVELDTYWVQMGGADVVEYIEKVSGRQPIIHLKDCGVNHENQTGFCEIGNGNLPWKRIIAAAEAGGTEWFAVEQDTCPGDEFDSLKISFEYIQHHLIEA